MIKTPGFLIIFTLLLSITWAQSEREASITLNSADPGIYDEITGEKIADGASAYSSILTFYSADKGGSRQLHNSKFRLDLKPIIFQYSHKKRTMVLAFGENLDLGFSPFTMKKLLPGLVLSINENLGPRKNGLDLGKFFIDSYFSLQSDGGGGRCQPQQ